jgi:hypothetical protein
VPRLVLELRAERISCSRAIGGDIARLRDVSLGLNMDDLPGPKTMGPLGWVEIRTPRVTDSAMGPDIDAREVRAHG